MAPKFLFAVMSALLLIMAVTPAFAQSAQLLQITGERPTVQEAITFLEFYLSGHPRLGNVDCGAKSFLGEVIVGDAQISNYKISPEKVTLAYCKEIRTNELKFSDFPLVGQRLLKQRGSNQTQLCVGTRSDADFLLKYNNCATAWTFLDVKDSQAFANAWLVLAHPPPRDPAKDQAFLEALRAAASAGDRTEANRRAQVQAEALVAANKNKDAAGLYRDALAASPDWSAGHYNLALVATGLGDLTEAITEMRRYLYLEPSAPDSRAVQDQIYKWEALRVAN